MAPKRWFEKNFDKFKDDYEFKLEGLLIDINEKICELMEEKNISRAELASKLGTSRAFVTKLLNGYPNMTLKTIFSIANALECELDVSFPPRDLVAQLTSQSPSGKVVLPSININKRLRETKVKIIDKPPVNKNRKKKTGN